MRKLYDPYAKFSKKRLSNGLSIFYLEEDRPWIVLLFCIHAGAADDPVGQEGEAHFVEHLIGQNIPGSIGLSEDQFKEFVEKEGGRINFGRTSYLSTAYSFQVLSRKKLIQKVLNIFGAMLLGSDLSIQVEEQRQIITLEFLESYGSETDMEIAEIWQSNMYADHWLKRFFSPFGRKETIQNMKKEEVQRFYEKHYTPANISLIGTGGILFDQLIEFLEKSPFGKTKLGEKNRLRKPIVNPSFPARNMQVIEASKFSKAKWYKGAYESRAFLPGSLRSETIALLYHMVTEKLNQNIRGKSGWTYGITPNWSFLQDVYEFRIEGNVSIGSLKNHQIHSLINESLEEIIDPDFFDYQKKKLIGALYLADQSLGEIVNSSWHDLEQRGKIVTRGDSLRELKRVSLNDIAEALQYLKPERRMTIILTP